MVAEQNGNYLRECWTEVLRCVSRFELLQQLTAGVPTDALLFAMPDKAGAASAADKLKRRLLRGRGSKDEPHHDAGLAHDSFSSINDMGLHASEWERGVVSQGTRTMRRAFQGMGECILGVPCRSGRLENLG